MCWTTVPSPLLLGLAVVDSGGVMTLWQQGTGVVASAPGLPPLTSVICLGGDGGHLVTGDHQGVVRVHDPSTLAPLSSNGAGHGGPLLKLAPLLTGRGEGSALFMSMGADKRVCVWEMAGELLVLRAVLLPQLRALPLPFDPLEVCSDHAARAMDLMSRVRWGKGHGRCYFRWSSPTGTQHSPS